MSQLKQSPCEPGGIPLFYVRRWPKGVRAKPNPHRACVLSRNEGLRHRVVGGDKVKVVEGWANVGALCLMQQIGVVSPIGQTGWE